MYSRIMSCHSFKKKVVGQCVMLVKNLRVINFHIEGQIVHPLDLVFSDVWGPSAVESIGRYKYYASFIDDFSKYTWFYLIKKKSDVFQAF
jgi:hypothetical protein